jgi:hypothetical protein
MYSASPTRSVARVFIVHLRRFYQGVYAFQEPCSRVEDAVKCIMVSMKLGWIGTVAFQAFDGKKELVFDLAEGLTLPLEFKEGDEITVVLHSDHPASIAMGMNAGYYEVTHVPSGKQVKVLHKTSEWRFT